MQNDNIIIHINYDIEVDQIMEEKENPSLQTKISRVSRLCEKVDEENTKHILEQYKFKEKNDIFIIKLPYVGFLLC